MVAEEFWAKWNFPLCLGAMDGKHMRIKPPSHSGATYRNYKGFFSIVQLALVDANLKFLYVDVGTNGRASDGGVWGKSKLRHAIKNGDINIPEAAALPGSASKLPIRASVVLVRAGVSIAIEEVLTTFESTCSSRNILAVKIEG
ncbi:DDE Tnp4 domain-containing protein [Trichonephila clavipes]|nr:DDE Tnp4 domain-containing protein [Trichonephila clavipes]